MTAENAEELRDLCDELGFTGFDDELRAVLGTGNPKVRRDVLGLRSRVDRHDVLIEELRARIVELERQVQDQVIPMASKAEAVEKRLEETDRALRDEIRSVDVSDRVGAVADAVGRLKSEMKDISTGVSDLSKEVSALKDAEAKGVTGANEPQSDGDSFDISKWMIDERDVEIDRSRCLDIGWHEKFKGTYKGRSVAVWVPSEYMDADDSKRRERAVSVFARMKHAGTLRLIGFHIPETVNCGPTILTPLMPNGTVADLLKKERAGNPDPRWDATKKSICVFGVAAAMAYVHSKGILHRDLKTANVFVNDQFEPVIGDFGLARMYYGELILGTYMAPELWIGDYGDKYTGASDVFAYAVFLFQMFSDSLTLDDSPRPARSPAQWQMRVGQGARLKRPDNVIPDFYWELITNCWNHNPDMRPKFFEILDVLQKNRASYAFPGADLGALEEYERRILEGVELVDRTGTKLNIVINFDAPADDEPAWRPPGSPFPI